MTVILFMLNQHESTWLCGSDNQPTGGFYCETSASAQNVIATVSFLCDPTATGTAGNADSMQAFAKIHQFLIFQQQFHAQLLSET
jgi:hypothetical protein